MQAAPHADIHQPRPVIRDGPDRRASSLRLLAVALITGVAAEQVGPSPLRAVLSGLRLDSAGTALSLVIALLLAVIIHEAGHLTAASLMDFSFMGASVGPLRVTHLHGRWDARLVARNPLSASISAIPRHMGDWGRRMSVVIAGGPGATLLSGIAAAVLFLNLPGDGAAKNFLVGLAQVSFYIFVLGLIPNARDARVRNDARLLLTVLNRSGEGQELFLYNSVEQQRLLGARPADLPRHLIHPLMEFRGRRDFCYYFAHTVAEWASDRGELTDAEVWYREALARSEDCDERIRSLARAHLAAFLLLEHADAESARKALQGVELHLLSPAYLAARTLAVAAFTEGNQKAVLDAIVTGRSALRSDLPLYQRERKLLAKLQAMTCATRFTGLGTDGPMGSKCSYLAE